MGRRHQGSMLASALLILLVIGALTFWMVPQMLRWRTQYELEERANRNALNNWVRPDKVTESSKRGAITGKQPLGQ